MTKELVKPEIRLAPFRQLLLSYCSINFIPAVRYRGVEQNREEMDSQDRFFKESIKQIHEKRCTKEENFDMLQQQECAKVVEHQQKNTNPSSKNELLKRAEEVSSFIEFQEKEMEFVEEREKLIDEQEKNQQIRV